MRLPLKAKVFPHVFIARDTRESSERLSEQVTKGFEALKVQYTDFGVLTTAQLHFMVANYRNPEPVPKPIEDKKEEKPV